MPEGRERRRFGAILAAALFLPLPALAGPNTATDLAGLFVQGCLPFVGDPAGLRSWARGQHLPEAPEPAREAFLHGAPGTVFDASTTQDKLVLVSSDDGICSAVTNHGIGSTVASTLEADLQRLGIRFRLVIERDDAHAPDLHYREYLAAKDNSAWRILVATVKGDKPGQAMLTSAPE